MKLRKVKAADLWEGAMLDLEGDNYADNRSTPDPALADRYAEVHDVDRETEHCVVVYTSCGAWGFPVDHEIRVLEGTGA